jgi:hypothetical protein
LTTFSLWDLKFPLGRFRIERCFQQFRVQSESLRLVSHFLQKITRQENTSFAENLLEKLQLAFGGDDPGPFLLPSHQLCDPPTPAALLLLEGTWPPQLPQFAVPTIPSVPLAGTLANRRRALNNLNFHKRNSILRKGLSTSSLIQPRDASFFGQCFPKLRDFKFTLGLNDLDLTNSQAFQACNYMEQVLVLFESGGTVAGVYREKQIVQEVQDFSVGSFFVWTSGRRVWHPRPVDFSQGNLQFPQGFPVFGCELTSSSAPKGVDSRPVHIQAVSSPF